MDKDTENTNVVSEVDEIPEGDISEESEEASETETETSEKETEQEEKETTKPEKTEETYDAKVKRLAQSMKDKELKTVYQELEDLRKQNKELNTQVTEKTWDKGIQEMFDEESVNLSEEEALKKKSRREDMKKQVLEYQKNSAYIEKTLAKLGKVDLDAFLKNWEKPSLDEAANYFNYKARDQQSREELWGLYFPEDAKKLAQIAKDMEKISKAKDPTQYEIVMEGIKESLKSKGPKYTPDSGRQGGGGKDMSKMSPEEKISEGFKELKKKK